MPTEENRLNRRRAWVRWFFGVIVAVIVTMVLTIQIIRDQTVAGCKRNAYSKLLDAQFMESAEQARRANGDFAKAAEYAELALNKRSTIVMPKEWQGASTTRGNSESDRDKGCEEAFPSFFSIVFS